MSRLLPTLLGASLGAWSAPVRCSTPQPPSGSPGVKTRRKTRKAQKAARRKNRG